jgi:hypothetical protein
MNFGAGQPVATDTRSLLEVFGYDVTRWRARPR